MLNPFPIQFLSLLAYAVLRFLAGGILLYLGHRHLKNRRQLGMIISEQLIPYGTTAITLLGALEVLSGIMFILGFYTQVAALFVMAFSLYLALFAHKIAAPGIPGRIFFTLLFAVAFSLFVTGAGVLAFDLPI